jgi:hypothetical protein
MGGYFLVGNPPATAPGQPGQPVQAYWQIGTTINKYDPDPAIQGTGFSGLVGQESAVENQYQLGLDIGQFARTSSGAGNFVPDFIGSTYLQETGISWFSNGAILNIPLGWLPSAALNGGLFAAVTSASIAADQLGVSYADQISFLLKPVPFLGTLEQIYQIAYTNDFNKDANAFNKAFGSSNSNEYS